MTREITTDQLIAAKMAGILAYHRGADYLHERVLPDGRTLFLLAMLFGNLRLCVSLEGDRLFFDQTFCYHDHDDAWRAVLGWDGTGDPAGWVRHHQTMRRRPDGTPESEYRAP